MKKYVVLSDFIDKNTGKIHEKSSKYEATEERAAELITKGFLEKPDEKPPKKPVKEKNDESSKVK